MKNDIMHYFIDDTSPELAEAISGSYNYDKIPYTEVLNYIRIMQSKRLAANDQEMSYTEVVNYCLKNNMHFHIIEGLSRLQLYKHKQLVYLEQFLSSENEKEIYNHIKDQIFEMKSESFLSMAVPNLTNALKDSSDAVSSFFIHEYIIRGVQLVKNNCLTYEYMNNFINNSLSLDELQVLDTV